MRYELFYLVSVSKELELETIKKEVEGIVTLNGGVFEEKEVQEKRKMAYKIRRDTHGIYIAKRFNLEEKKNVKEIITKLNLYPGVTRFIISDASELPELKTKEERMKQEQKRNEREDVKNELKEIEETAAAENKAIAQKNLVAEQKAEEAEKVEEAEVIEPKKEVKKETVESEDIDKKLEEILNI